MGLQFKIIGVKIERDIEGDTTIKAICINTDTEFSISIKNSLNNDKDYIRDILVDKYNDIMRKRQPVIAIGDIL